MLDFLELEETVGRFWHRLVGRTASWPHHPEAAVTLAEMGGVLGVCFRGFGGERGARLVPAQGRSARHRLAWRQRVGLGEERLVQPYRTADTLHLPPAIALYPERSLNRDLYVWLACCMAAEPEPVAAADPLQRDLALVAAAGRMVEAVLAAFPGLAGRYRRLAAATLAARQRDGLPVTEAKVEALIRSRLQRAAGWTADAGDCSISSTEKAPPGYLPALPVPLWPWAVFAPPPASTRRRPDESPPPAAPLADPGLAHHAAQREVEEKGPERSPFILNRFEKILAMSEMVRVDRPSDDSVLISAEN